MSAIVESRPLTPEEGQELRGLVNLIRDTRWAVASILDEFEKAGGDMELTSPMNNGLHGLELSLNVLDNWIGNEVPYPHSETDKGQVGPARPLAELLPRLAEITDRASAVANMSEEDGWGWHLYGYISCMLNAEAVLRSAMAQPIELAAAGQEPLLLAMAVAG